MTVANRLKFTVAITSAATITPPASPNVGGYRVLAQAIAAADLAANTTGVPLICEDASNNWEESYFAVSADGLSFTRTSVAASSAGGTTPATFTGTVTVYCTMFADYVNKLLTTTNGTDVSALAQLTSTAAGDAAVVLRSGNLYLMPTSLFGTASADTTPPTFVSAQVANSTPTVVQVTMSEPLGATAPPASALAVSKNGGAVTVSSVTTSGSVMLVTVASAFVSTDASITVTYTKPANGNMLTDAAATPNATSTFGPSTVTNNVSAATDTTAPTANSAAVANATPTAVVITMSEAMNTTFVPAATAFTVGGHTVSSVAVSGSTISLTVDVFVNGEAARTVAYTQPGANNARDLAGNLLANFAGLAITNNVAATGTMAATYLLRANVNSGTFPTGPTAMAVASPDNNINTTGLININIRSAANAVPADANIKFVWAKYGNPCPIAFTDGSVPIGATGNTQTHGNTVVGPNHLGGWSDNTSQYYGTYNPVSNLFIWGTAGDYMLYIVYSDGSSKAVDNNTGTPLKWTLT